MKKVLLLLFVSTLSANIIAQNDKIGKAAPVNTQQNVVKADEFTPPPPPPPPPPPVQPAAPPPPPAPPMPPKQHADAKFNPPVIVNDKGFDLSVHYINDVNIIYAKKKGITEKIPMTKWYANQSYYEKEYGKLPPPPPVAPVAAFK